MKKIILMSIMTMCLATANAQDVTVLKRDGASQAADSNKVYSVAEKMPEFPGGQQALMQYISYNVRYPKDAAEKGKQGRVVVEFVVNEDGSISDEKVTRSVFPSLDNEALRVIKNMPKWQPGVVDGKNVRVKYTIPLSFKLPAPEPLRPNDAK